MKTTLRVYHGSTDQAPPAPPTVRLKLRDLFPLLVKAHRFQYAWLKDLADDEIAVTEDLAEILAEFDAAQSDRRGA